MLESGLRARIDISSLMSDLNLSYSDLDHLSAESFAAFWLEVSKRMGDEFFGLGQRPMAPGSFTLMGHAVRGARTFEIALRRALRFLKVVVGEPYGELHINDGICTIQLHETNGFRSAFAYRTFFLILHGLNCWLVRERIPLRHIQFPCRAPSANNDYGDFFGKPVTFDAPDASLSFDTKYLKRPTRRSEKELKVFLRSTPETFLRGYRPVLSLKRQILDICKAQELSQMPSTKVLAAQLGMSKSTLHRRLRVEGQAIRLIKDEIRRSKAAYLLKFTDASIDEIAQSAGYAEPSAFHRAFRAWYQTTPGEMRRKQRHLKNI
ncbi:AraC family transcriptional regulator [Sulfitobacter sp. EhC04]|uniref:AraC family transcriptional regulator n=1 Tax=Sulfitobacter sp. EhC04 TaxID=1849168 RepID=UPI0009EE3551|nr:AraC family transcriptional regulator [Sulfitobacter sp. EhC04]